MNLVGALNDLPKLFVRTCVHACMLGFLQFTTEKPRQETKDGMNQARGEATETWIHISIFRLIIRFAIHLTTPTQQHPTTSASD